MKNIFTALALCVLASTASATVEVMPQSAPIISSEQAERITKAKEAQASEAIAAETKASEASATASAPASAASSASEPAAAKITKSAKMQHPAVTLFKQNPIFYSVLILFFIIAVLVDPVIGSIGIFGTLILESVFG